MNELPKNPEEMPSDDPIFWKWEREWLDSQRRYSLAELAKIFPEGKGVVRELLIDRVRQYAILLQTLKERLKAIKGDDNEHSRMVRREVVKVYGVSELLKLKREIKKFRYFLSLYGGGGKRRRKSWSELHEAALEVPITDVARLHVKNIRQTGRNFTGQCPFHDDRHPSLVIYVHTNSWYCFGCQKGGSVINFVQTANRCSYKKAVRILNGQNIKKHGK